MRQASGKILGNIRARTDAPARSAARPATRNASSLAASAAPANSCVTTPMRGALTVAPGISSGRLVMADSPRARSSTPAANRPTVSSVHEKHFTPTVGSTRNDGFIAATPQYDAGRITEPPVCVPSASGIIPAATAAADPDDDPPGVCAWLRGLSVAVGSREANPVVVVLPAMEAPACFSSITTGASARGRQPR